MTDRATAETGPRRNGALALQALLAYTISVVLIIIETNTLHLRNLTLDLLIAEIGLIAIPAAAVLLMHRKTVDRGQFAIPDTRQFLLTVWISVCTIPVAVYTGIAARKALIGLDTSGVNVVEGISFPLLVLLAPLCEELLFRPLIQNGLARQWGDRAAVFLTAVLFALFHLSLLRVAETFVLGLFVGIVFLKTRRYWCSVIVHCAGNAMGPMLWRYAPELILLLNPVTSIGLACIACAGCLFLGERSPMPLKGLWHRLNWALFGAPQGLQMTSTRARGVFLLAGANIAWLTVLMCYAHAVMICQPERPKFNTSYVVSEEDEWTVTSANEVSARSRLTIERYPETYEDLTVCLPFENATVHEVKLGDNDLPFYGLGVGRYRIDLSSHQDAARSGTITVRWKFAVANLVLSSDRRLWTPLTSLAPSNSFALTVTVEKGSGYRLLLGDGEVRSRCVFSGGAPGEPRMDYGRWGGLGEASRFPTPRSSSDQPR